MRGMKKAEKSSAQPEADEIQEDDLVQIEEIQITRRFRRNSG